jgi:hypothetical protein
MFNINPLELKSADSKDHKSPQGEQIPVQVAHSSLGEQDQVTHTTRKRKNGKSDFNSKFCTSKKFLREMNWKGFYPIKYSLREEFDNLFPDPEFDDWVFDEYWDEVTMEESNLLYGVRYTQPPQGWHARYYSHNLFPYALNGERIPIPSPNKAQTSYVIDASKALCLDPPHEDLEAQMGFEQILASKGTDLTDSALSWIEDLVALYTALRECTTISQFTAICVMFIKQHVSGSLVRITLDYFHEIMGGLEPQDSSDDPSWILFFKQLKTNWDTSVSSPMFGKLSKLLAMAVSIGLCQLSDVTFDIYGVKAFSLNLKEKHTTAKDFFQCLLDTVVFFIEGGYQCFKQRSLRPLFVGDSAMLEYEKNYYLCLECADLAKAGNLQKFKDMTDNDFDKLLSDTLATCEGFCRASHPGTEKNLLLRQKEKLLMCHSQFRQTRLLGGLRVAPYAIGVFGPSGVGKSSIAQLLMTCALQANDYNADDDRVVTLNESDKFMSNYKSYVNGVYIDDLGNTKTEFVERSPAQKIIELVNNVQAYAPQAEAEMKGKVAIEPKVVLITRNVKERFAHEFSNEPASILRREKITLTVSVRDQYATQGMLDQDKVNAAFGRDAPVIQDLWLIDVERAYPVKNNLVGRPDNVGWEPVKLDGKELLQCSIFDVIRYVQRDSQSHFGHQKELVERTKDISAKLDVCSTCKFPAQMCTCTSCLEPHFGLHDVQRFVSSSADDFVGGPVCHAYQELRNFDASWVSVLNCMPDWLFHSVIGRSYLEWRNYPLYTEQYEWVKTRTLRLLCALGLMCLFDSRMLIVMLCVLVHACHSILAYREFLINEVLESRASVPLILKDFRDNQAKYLTRSCLAIASIYALVKAWRVFNRFTPQGNLSPTSMQEIRERDAEENPWLGVSVTPLHTSDKSKCITLAHLESLVAQNLCHMSYEYDGKRAFCDAFFPCSNVAILPQHIWKANELIATFSRKGNLVIGGHFKAPLSRSLSVNIPSTDMCMVWIANGGSWKDLTGYFPLGSAVRCPASVIFKAEDGSVEKSQTVVEPGLVRAAHMAYYGLNYTLDKETFKGLCMAPIVSQTRAPAIIGFHLAGKTGTRIGAGGSLTQHQVHDAIERLRNLEGVLLSTSNGDMPRERYDVQFYEGEEIHKHSPVRFLPKGANIEVYGSCRGRARHFSEVVQTPISEHVTSICGIDNKWGKPKFHLGEAWQVSLAHSCKPSPGMPGDHLQAAVFDYKQGFIEKLKTVPGILKETVPLTEMETVCGIDGRRFVDKMPGRTSMGYPLGGPKNDHLTLLDPEEYPSHACPMQLDGVFWDEAKKMEDAFREKKRGYAIFKGCLKDEPTSVVKDKVRVFQSAPIELQLLVRKYYLPVARLLSLFPLDSECAVGINAQGPEWEQFTEHIGKFGKDRIFAGDYSKYDLRMPAQLVLAAFRILIDIAELCGYSDDHIRVMEGIATEIAYPLMAYNGDLLMLFGSNPSGQNLTVFINGIVNSLLVRCYLFSLKLIPRVRARDVVAFLTYGDDIKGSNNSKYPISIKGYAAFLAKYDMVFTMPDKNSELVDLMKDEDADFLKRKNVYVPEIQMHLGALDEMSIFKSLHTVLRSPAVSLKEQCMMNIDGALREWFAHGREVYEMRRKQMQEVASLGGIAHGCSGLELTYDDRIFAFAERYQTQSPFLRHYIEDKGRAFEPETL